MTTIHDVVTLAEQHARSLAEASTQGKKLGDGELLKIILEIMKVLLPILLAQLPKSQ